MVYGMPAGCWQIVGPNQLRATHFSDPNAIFSTGASYGPAHERYGSIYTNNISDFLNPTIVGDQNFHRRLIAMTIDSSNAAAEAQNSAYSDNYGIYNTGIFD